jgi:hypothetical protein
MSTRKRRVYERPSMYKESAEEVINEFRQHPWSGKAACNLSFITYDASNPKYNPKDPATWTPDLYIGKLVIDVEGDIPEEALAAELKSFTEKPTVSRHVDPPLWAKAWDYLTKTKAGK